MDAAVVGHLCDKFQALRPVMDERMRRHWAAVEAAALGWGGVSMVALATGLSRNTIAAGLEELRQRQVQPALQLQTRLRKPGAGRKSATETHPRLARALDLLVDPVTRGHPMSPLRWTCRSTRKLAEELGRQGFAVCDRTVARLLREADFSLQANRKTREGESHPDRDAQFRHIHRRVLDAQRRGQPVVSVDTKKKELVGEFKNAGREWQPQGEPERVKSHDFPDPKLGKAIPYGVYDVTSNEGWVSVGIDQDTAPFAAASIRRWWQEMGSRRFPRVEELTITADGGGSNSPRNRLWSGAAGAGQRPGDEAARVPFPARDQQVEQDRAPDVLPHHDELAGPAADELRGRGAVDREHAHGQGAVRARGPGPRLVRGRDQGERRGAVETEDHTSKVPRRLELHRRSSTLICSFYFFADPKE